MSVFVFPEDVKVSTSQILEQKRTIGTGDDTSIRMDGLDVLQDKKSWGQDLEANCATWFAGFSVGQNEAFQLVVVEGRKV